MPDVYTRVHAAVEKIQEVLDIHSITIFLIDDKTGLLELRASRGISETFAAAINHRRVGEGFNGWVAQTGGPCLVTDVASDPRRSDDAVIREGVKSLCIVPVKSKDKFIGTMGVHSLREKAFDAPTVDALKSVYAELGSEVAERPGKDQVTSAVVGLALILLVVGAGVSLRLTGRIV